MPYPPSWARVAPTWEPVRPQLNPHPYHPPQWMGLGLPSTARSIPPAQPRARRDSPCPDEGLLLTSVHGPAIFPEGVARLSFTARIERPPFHRGGSASKKDGLATPSLSFLRPRVARARKAHQPLIPTSFSSAHSPSPDSPFHRSPSSPARPGIRALAAFLP